MARLPRSSTALTHQLRAPGATAPRNVSAAWPAIIATERSLWGADSRQWSSTDLTDPWSSAVAVTLHASIVAATVGGCSTVVSTTAPAADPSLPVTVTVDRRAPSGAVGATSVVISTTPPGGS